MGSRPRPGQLAHSHSTAPTLPSERTVSQRKREAQRRLSTSDTGGSGSGSHDAVAAAIERPTSRSSQVARKLSKLLDPRKWRWGGRKRRPSASGQSVDSAGGGSARSAHTTSSEDSGGFGTFMHQPPGGVGVAAEHPASTPDRPITGAVTFAGEPLPSTAAEYSPVYVPLPLLHRGLLGVMGRAARRRAAWLTCASLTLLWLRLAFPGRP